MFSWMLNPLMLGMGGLAIGVPILIHLLNRRRYKIVDWAAMDFLLEADKKNRRRVQLENLLILALRCLAMLLLGLLLARPFLPSAMTALLGQKEQFERVVLLDDSLSQQVLVDNLPALEGAKSKLKELLTDLAQGDVSDDWLTLFLTSNTEQPILANEPVTRGTLPTLLDAIDGIDGADGAADYGNSLAQVKQYVAGQRDSISRIVYLLSDLRRRDWIPEAGETAETAPNRLVQELGKEASQGFVVDIGSPSDQNLGIVDVRSEDLLVANRVVRFEVDVASFAREPINNLKVSLQIDEQPPIVETLEQLPAGGRETVTFRYLFRPVESERMDAGESQVKGWQNHRIRVEFDRQSLVGAQTQLNQLLDDDSRFFGARILNGIPVLLVDGDPSADSQRSETHYLRYLDIFGTGLQTSVVTISDLETIPLADFKVIFLCNVDEISGDRVKVLEQWTRDGGAVVFMPGNQVRAEAFNATFYRDGQGLCPLQLEAIAGDPTMSSWVNFEVDPQVHPALRTVVESDAASLGKVDVFSWWTSRLSETLRNEVVVPLRLSDENRSPALVDRAWGKGKVIAFSIPADGDWSVFPGMDAVFVPVMLDLIDYLIGSGEQASTLAIGGRIDWPVDLSAYQNRVTLRDPANEKMEVLARPVDESPEAAKSVIYSAEFSGLEKRGFYELGLTRNSGETESVLFAANVPADEGRLERLNPTELESDFWGEKFKLLPVSGLLGERAEGRSAEMWPQVIWLLLIVLGTEQFLAWWFGKRR